MAQRNSEYGRLPDVAYLATPYTKYPRGISEAFIEACRIAAKLLRAGVKCYSPIAYTHPIAIWGHIDPLDLSVWLPFDEAMMKAADTLIVAHMTGWEESSGVKHEIEFFERANKPIFDLDPETMVMTRRQSALANQPVNTGYHVYPQPCEP